MMINLNNPNKGLEEITECYLDYVSGEDEEITIDELVNYCTDSLVQAFAFKLDKEGRDVIFQKALNDTIDLSLKSLKVLQELTSFVK